MARKTYPEQTKKTKVNKMTETVTVRVANQQMLGGEENVHEIQLAEHAEELEGLPVTSGSNGDIIGNIRSAEEKGEEVELEVSINTEKAPEQLQSLFGDGLMGVAPAVLNDKVDHFNTVPKANSLEDVPESEKGFKPAGQKVDD